MGIALMLIELRIQDFAVIHALTIEFGPGLNVLSGETGAGKSIIVDALTVALGARASSDLVRTGAAAARVEARFAVDRDPPVRAWLTDRGLGDAELVVAREIGSDGRSRAWINGRPSTVGMLRELGDQLVEIIGQHESQQLLRPQTHLEVLDAFAGPSALALRAEVASRVARRAALRAEHEALAASERDRVRRIDFLRHQVQEIDAAKPRPGEDEALAARRTRLANAGRLAAAAAGAYAALYEAEQGAAIDRLGHARSALREVAGLDPALAPVVERIEALIGEVTDIARQLASYRSAVEDQPDELEAVEARLALLQALRRKYGETIEDVLAAREQAAAELAGLDASDARRAAIAAELEVVDRELIERCGRLTLVRRMAARRLETSVDREFGMLELKRARLRVGLGHDPDPDGLQIGAERVAVGPTGADRVEFLLAANPGEEARPLVRVASGGELSRVMLALRHVLAATNGTPVMVFDEVEAGIGARTAGAVGRVLTGMARTRQVLCVTHLAEIASLADHHFWVTKDVVRGRTVVHVQPLAGTDRTEEIARMLSGRMPTPTARDYASELLARARRRQTAGSAPKGS
ncbi:MAG: DNA repair protein RecN [Armatimonadota bacterium]|nr:DNA repair protein RecN [Armatimonadota bacterium]